MYNSVSKIIRHRVLYTMYYNHKIITTHYNLSFSLSNFLFLKHWSTVIDTEVPCHKLTVSLPSQRESSVLHYKIAMTNCTAPIGFEEK